MKDLDSRLDELLNALDISCRQGRFDEVNDILEQTKTEELTMLIAALGVTQRCKELLPARRDIVNIIQKDYPDRVEKLLQNLI